MEIATNFRIVWGYMFGMWFLNSTLLATWVLASLKVAFIFCAIVMVRICTPRFGLGAITRLSWGSLFVYFTLFFLIYAIGLMWL